MFSKQAWARWGNHRCLVFLSFDITDFDWGVAFIAAPGLEGVDAWA